ncbi:MAG TPA: DUF202 domain-containing protein [Nocardioidaceae bacterium]|jgi:uncharacterized membrane protein YidH (DUF202 family)|nr:DUF202 domain-containing protein [Nocardioidaceae bacterium]
MVDDIGVANERTALAWQRTALALIAGTAVMARLSFNELGWSALGILSIAMLLSSWVFVESWLRYSQHAGARLRARDRGGRAAAALATATVLIAVTELVAQIAA